MFNPHIIHHILSSARDLERAHFLEVLARQENEFKFPKTQQPVVAVGLLDALFTLPVLGVKYDPQDWDQDLTVFLQNTPEESPYPDEVITVDETQLLPGELLRIAELIPEERIDIDTLKLLFEQLRGSYPLDKQSNIIVDPISETVECDSSFIAATGIGAYRFIKKAGELMDSGTPKEEAVIRLAKDQYGFDLPF